MGNVGNVSIYLSMMVFGGSLGWLIGGVWSMMLGLCITSGVCFFDYLSEV